MWQTTQSTFLSQCLSDVTGQNPNKDFIRVNVEFMKSRGSTQSIVYPNMEQINQCIGKLASYSQDEVKRILLSEINLYRRSKFESIFVPSALT
jgi:hypothetical protein